VLSAKPLSRCEKNQCIFNLFSLENMKPRLIIIINFKHNYLDEHYNDRESFVLTDN